MSGKDINLLAIDIRTQYRQALILRYYKIVAFSLLAIVGVAGVIIFVLRLISPLNSLAREEATLTSDIVGLSSKLARFNFVKQRVGDVEGIVSKRSKFDAVIDKITSKSPDGVTIDSMNISPNQVSLSVTSTSLVGIDGFINNLIAESTRSKTFTKILMNNLSLRGDSGSYSLQLELSM